MTEEEVNGTSGGLICNPEISVSDVEEDSNEDSSLLKNNLDGSLGATPI